MISGSGGLTKIGAGTLTLDNANTYTGATTVNAGTLALSFLLPPGFGLGTTGSIAASSGLNLAASGATFDISVAQANQTIKDLTGVAGSSIVLGGSTLTAGTANSTSFAGVISGSGGFTKAGTGTLTLSGANTYSGTTQINGGILSSNNSNVFSPNSVVSIAAGATLDLGTLFDQTIAGLSGAGSVNMGVAQLTVNQAGATTYSGVISGGSGSGSGLVKSGAGTLTLTGANTYQGATNINSGTLALAGNGSIASSPAVFLNGGTFDVSGVNAITAVQTLLGNPGTTVNVGSKTLIFGGSTPGAPGVPDFFLGSFAGAGGLIYNGTDAAFLNGNSSGFTGTLLITAGTVSIGGDLGNQTGAGSIFGGNVTVNSGGTLAGMGTILGNVNTMGGTTRPGGSIGTLTVNGNYTQSSTGTLAIEVSPTASSKLVVGGAASLAGTLKLMFDPGVYSPTTSFNFLTASSVSGSFSTVISNNPLLSQTLVYGPTGVTTQTTVLAPTNDTVYTGVTSTAMLTAQQFNSLILDRIGNRQGGAADGEVASLAAPVFAGAPTAQQYANAGNIGALGDALSALPQSALAEGAWFRGVGDFASVNGNSTAPGFTGSTGGFMAGYDRPVMENVYLGVAGGYLHSNIDEHSTSNGTEGSARVALYGGAYAGPSLFTATAGYARDWFDSSRGITGFGTASEQHAGDEATAAGQWSLPLSLAGYGGGAASLTPKAGFQFVHLSENGFAESGAGGFDLSSASHGTDSFQPYIGAALAQKFVTDNGTQVTPEVRAGYAYETLSNARLLTVTTVGGAAFPVTGLAPSRNQLSAGFGLTMIAGPNLQLFANYDAVLPTGNTTEQTVQAGLRIRF